MLRNLRETEYDVPSQEFANPRVHPNLRFLPEDAGSHLSEAWQGDRWLRELDPDLATPMVRVKEQDFYVLEPTQLVDGRVCMPFRWFTRGSDTFAFAWMMVPSDDRTGWVIAKDCPVEIDVHELLTPYPKLCATYLYHGIPNPRNVIGEMPPSDTLYYRLSCLCAYRC